LGDDQGADEVKYDYHSRPIQVQYADDSKVFKDRLMQLVTKGKQEAEITGKTNLRLINQVKMDEMVQNKEYLEEAAHTINTSLERPPLDHIDPKTQDIRFMCVDIDTYSDKPPSYAQHRLVGSECSIVRLYGVNDKGNSLTIHAYNFRPYIYMQVPNTMNLHEGHLCELRNHLNTRMNSNFNYGVHPITEIEICFKKSIMHY
jgi:hypothetical protein